MDEKQQRERKLEEKQAEFNADRGYHADLLRGDVKSNRRWNSIKQRFRLGAKRLCAREMWSQIEATAKESDPIPLTAR